VATALLRQWINTRKTSVKWTTVADMVASLKEASDKWAEALKFTGPMLLVLDDLDNSDMTPWVREQVVAVIKKRYQEGRALILTSNVSPFELTDFDPSVVSRLAEGIVRKFEGEDYRLKAGRK
jgi:DNA replication protein DnaC